jgi:hypothetical protein
MSATNIAERIESRIDKGAMQSLSVVSRGGSNVPAFTSMNEIMEFAKLMAVSDVSLPKHLRNNVGACAAIIMQAQNWGMDPIMEANKSYHVNDRVAYESQLIAAVINTRAKIKGRLRTKFIGEGQDRQCIAYAIFEGEDDVTEVITPKIKDISPKNSPLWKSDPDQQLSYYAKRAFARRECPELLLGIYDVEEAQAMTDTGSTSTAAPPPPPTRADFEPKVVEPSKVEVLDKEQPRKAKDAPPAPEPVAEDVTEAAETEGDKLAAAEAQGELDAEHDLARDPDAHGFEPGPVALAYLAGWDRGMDKKFPGGK